MRSSSAPLLAAAAVACLLGCSRQPPRLLVIITSDTLRADRLGSYGNPLGLTPHLDRLARRSVRFAHLFTPMPLTLPAVTALMTGLYPQELGVRSNASELPDGVETLASVLRAHGWRTGAVVSSAILDPRSKIAHGFERYDYELRQYERNRKLPERVAPDTTTAAIRMLDALAGDPAHPLLLWVHYQDPHGPYTPTDDCRAPAGEPPPGVRDRRLPISPDDAGEGAIPVYQLLGAERESASYRAAYNGEVRCLDRAVGRLLAEVERRGLLQHAVVVFTADHGEDLGERDSWFQHGARLTRAETRVPLLLQAPGKPAEVRQDVASLLDVIPTLLRLAGVVPPPHLRGRDLFALGARYRASSLYLATPPGPGKIARRGFVSGRYFYVREERPVLALERMRRLGAPLSDVLRQDPIRAERMREEVTEWRERLANPQPEKDASLSPQLRATLRALGYAR